MPPGSAIAVRIVVTGICLAVLGTVGAIRSIAFYGIRRDQAQRYESAELVAVFVGLLVWFVPIRERETPGRSREADEEKGPRGRGGH